MRGIYNNRFNELTRCSKEQEVIDRLWFFCYNNLKKDIWIPRCDEVTRLEQIKGITSRDKKKSKKDVLKGEDLMDNIKNNNSQKNYDNNIKKEEKNKELLISLGTRDRLISHATPGSINHLDKVWHTIQKL